MKIIIVEGLIAAGKTSLLRVLENSIENCKCIYEPVDEWEQSGALDSFYKALNEPESSAKVYLFQTYAFMTRIKRIQKVLNESPAEIYFLERSIFSDRHMFMEMLRDSGKLIEQDYQMYLDWWELWELVMPVRPDGFIYLNPSTEECMRRLKSRNREEESQVDIDYQMRLKEKHDKFLTETVTVGDSTVPCLQLETDVNFKDNTQHREEIVEKIMRFVGEL